MDSGQAPTPDALWPASTPASGFVSVPLFQTIPPERVGLNGEYDHNGLAKRVAVAFSEHCHYEEIKHIKVSQRGVVITLLGEVTSQRLLSRLVTIAMQVSGAGGIEVNGVSIVPPFAYYCKPIMDLAS